MKLTPRRWSNPHVTRSRKERVLAAFAALAAIVIVVGSVQSAMGQSLDDRFPWLSAPGAAQQSAPGGAFRREPPAEIVALVNAAAWSAGVPARIAQALVRHESGYRAGARGAAGEYGLTQIKCQSARGIGFSGQCRDLADASTNLTWGLKFLRIALDKGGETCAGVSLHNLGIHAHPRCTRYGKIIMANAAR